MSKYPDFRFIGHSPYPFPSGSLPPAVAESILEIARAPNPRLTIRIMSDHRALIIHRKQEGNDRTRVSHRVFDTKNNVLLSIKVMSEAKDPAQTRPVFTERYEWKQVGGIFVPESIVGESHKFRKAPDGEQLRWIESYDVKLRWFGVNSGIIADTSGDDILNDANAVLKFVTAEGKAGL